MKSTKAAKHERRAHRKGKRGRARTTSPFGGADLDGLIAAFDPLAPWPDIAPRILPILKRAWHPYPVGAEPVHVNVPPGITTGFGIDLGPAFSHVTPGQLDVWDIDQATLLGTALENLRSLVRREPPVVQRFRQEGVDIQAAQGHGWGSALLLLPDVIRSAFGAEPRILLAPVRNTLIALPETVDPEFAFDLWQALASGAHDALDVDPLRWTGTAVVALQDVATRGLPN